jgi:type II secretory pathway pseudopilin PulG
VRRTGRDQAPDWGMTLIEVLIGVFITAVLAGVTIPTVLQQQKMTSQAVAKNDGASLSATVSGMAATMKSLGTPPQSGTEAITVSGTTLMLKFTGADPNIATLTGAVNLTEGVSIGTSGMSGRNWCFTAVYKDQIAVYSNYGFLDSGYACAKDGTPLLNDGTYARGKIGAAEIGEQDQLSAFLPAPSTPVLNADGNGSAAAIKNNRLTWNEVTCQTGIVQYDLRMVIKDGQNGDWFQSGWRPTNTYNVPADWITHSSTYGFVVRAGCFEGSASGISPWSNVYTLTTDVPLPPANLRTGSDQTQLTWDAITWCPAAFVAEYRVVQSTSKGVTGTFYTSEWQTTRTFTIPAEWVPEAGYSYGYKVQARCNGELNSGYGPPLVSTVPLLAPALTMDTFDQTSATVSWSATYAALGYQTRIRVNEGAWATTPAAAQKLTHTFTSLSAGSLIDVQVRATSSAGESPWSNTVSAQIPAPMSGVVLPPGNQEVRWDQATWCRTGDLTEYQVVQTKRAGVSGTFANSSWSPENSFMIPSSWVTFYGTSYEYKVRARCVSTTGKPTLLGPFSTVSFLLEFPAPTLNRGTVTDNSVLVSWPQIPGAVSFEARTSRNGGAYSAVIPVASTSSYTFGGLTAGDTLTVQLRAKNATSTGPWSTALSTNLTFSMPGEFLFSGWTRDDEAGGSSTGVWARCATGTVPTFRYQEARNGTSGAWSAWLGASSDPNASTAGRGAFHTNAYGQTVAVTWQAACKNPTTNVTSNTNTWGPVSVTRAVPAPMVWIAMTGYHQVSWGVTCPTGASARVESWKVYTDAWGWATGGPYNGNAGVYYRPEAAAWGSGDARLQLQARCYIGDAFSTTTSAVAGYR